MSLRRDRDVRAAATPRRLGRRRRRDESGRGLFVPGRRAEERPPCSHDPTDALRGESAAHPLDECHARYEPQKVLENVQEFVSRRVLAPSPGGPQRCLICSYLYVPEIAVMGDLASLVEGEARNDGKLQVKRRGGPERHIRMSIPYGRVCVG